MGSAERADAAASPYDRRLDLTRSSLRSSFLRAAEPHSPCTCPAPVNACDSSSSGCPSDVTQPHVDRSSRSRGVAPTHSRTSRLFAMASLARPVTRALARGVASIAPAAPTAGHRAFSATARAAQYEHGDGPRGSNSLYTLSEEEVMLQESVRRFAQEVVAPKGQLTRLCCSFVARH